MMTPSFPAVKPKESESGAAPAGVLSVNVGSSSLKFAFYPVRQGEVFPATEVGTLEGLEAGEAAFEAALKSLFQRLGAEHTLEHVLAVAHRVVHGGGVYADSVLASDEVLQDLARFNPLAPLHQPHNLAGVARFRAALPEVPQVICFDTAFHQEIAPTETHFALPDHLLAQGIRRYGFHGLSYQHVCHMLWSRSQAAQGRLLMAHLGNGASLCAARAGQSCATTMGFTALDGLMMGTRSGALDPGVVLYLLAHGWNAEQIEHLLYRQSGLLGVSGLSSDMRVLRASDDARARFAIEAFTARVIRESGALIAVLRGLDALVFTGGIGEHDIQLREDVAQGLAWLGVELDQQANQAARGQAIMAIHGAQSKVEVWVVPADEGRATAREAVQLLGL